MTTRTQSARPDAERTYTRREFVLYRHLIEVGRTLDEAEKALGSYADTVNMDERMTWREWQRQK